MTDDNIVLSRDSQVLAMLRSPLGDGKQVYIRTENAEDIGIIIGGDDATSVVVFPPRGDTPVTVRVIDNSAIVACDNQVENEELSMHGNRILRQIVSSQFNGRDSFPSLLGELLGRSGGGERSERYYAQLVSPLGDKSFVRIAGCSAGLVIGGDANKTVVATSDGVGLYATSSLTKIDDATVPQQERVHLLGAASAYLIAAMTGERGATTPTSATHRAAPSHDVMSARLHALELRVHELESELAKRKR